MGPAITTHLEQGSVQGGNDAPVQTHCDGGHALTLFNPGDVMAFKTPTPGSNQSGRYYHLHRQPNGDVFTCNWAVAANANNEAFLSLANSPSERDNSGYAIFHK